MGIAKNDLYMLHAADVGYLCIGGSMSRSLKEVDTSNLRLVYDKATVILNESYESEVMDDIAICKFNSGINGSRPAQAHYTLGQKVGIEISKTILSDDAAVLVLERGGRFFDDGLYMTFGGNFHPYNPSEDFATD